MNKTNNSILFLKDTERIPKKDKIQKKNSLLPKETFENDNLSNIETEEDVLCFDGNQYETNADNISNTDSHLFNEDEITNIIGEKISSDETIPHLNVTENNSKDTFSG